MVNNNPGLLLDNVVLESVKIRISAEYLLTNLLFFRYPGQNKTVPFYDQPDYKTDFFI